MPVLVDTECTTVLSMIATAGATAHDATVAHATSPSSSRPSWDPLSGGAMPMVAGARAWRGTRRAAVAGAPRTKAAVLLDEREAAGM